MPEVLYPSPDSTLVVILGASSWPEISNFVASEAFSNSATSLVAYFLEQFRLPQSNLLNLFDSQDSQEHILREIKRFIEERHAKSKEEGSEITDLLIYYTGHGLVGEEKTTYLLAVKHTSEAHLDSSALQVKALANLIKNSARFLRHYIIIDACFSASALSFFQSVVEQIVEKDVAAAFGEDGKSDDFATRGTSLLCSSSLNDVSKLAPSKQHTMFTEALLFSLLDQRFKTPQKLSLADLKERITDYLSLHYKATAPPPEVHSPNQKYGDVAKVPFFPNLGIGADNLKVNKYTIEDDQITCCVIVSEFEEGSEEGELLESIVKKSLLNFRKDIEGIAKKSLKPQPFVIHCTKLFSSDEGYIEAIKALCRCEIAVFDLTNYEPIVMFLLGIRSVVRRGITITSAGGDYVIGDTRKFPFLIKEVNIVSHSELQIEQDSPDKDPINLIGERIISGFKHMAQLPNYLDLPAYDAVRNLPPESINQVPRQYTDEVLLLCSFSEQYRDLNWKKHLKRNLPIFIKTNLSDEAQASIEPNKPGIVRTLDMKTPRLVSQSLFEAIRLTEMCVIDLTEWQPNVLFELGVRLAVNSINPVCIIEEQHATFIRNMAEGQTSSLLSSLASDSEEKEVVERIDAYKQQCISIMEVMKPILYKVKTNRKEKADEEATYLKMINRFLDARQELASEECKNVVYETVSRWIDHQQESSARPVYNELLNSANLMNNPDGESYGRSPVLYRKNEDLVKNASAGALERRIAAWLYIDKRYTSEEIVNDPMLANVFDSLGSMILASLSSSPKDKDLKSYLRARLRYLKSIEES